MGKETRQPSTPRKAPYQAPPQTPTGGGAAQDQQYIPASAAQSPSQAASPAYSSGTSHSARSSPHRVSPGSSPGPSGQGSATGSNTSTGVIDPKLFTLLKHGIVSHTFGSKLAEAFFGEIFAMTAEHIYTGRSGATYRPTDTAYYRHSDRAFTRAPAWAVDDAVKIRNAVVDYAIDERCGSIIRYNSAGADWKPPRWFTEKVKPGLHWFQSPAGGAGIKLEMCKDEQTAYHFLRMPEGQRVKCMLSKYQTCNLRIKWKGFPDRLFEINAMHPSFTREMYLHELAAAVGAQVMRYFAEVANTVPRLNPTEDVIILGLIHLNDNEWTVMLQHCPPELRRIPPPGWQGAPQGSPVWAFQSPPQGWNADAASIASGSSGSRLSTATTLADAANAGKKHKYADSVASASPGYAPSYTSGASPSAHSQYSERR